ncbi:MAG: hypothetical protein DI603_06095 [Roseateles depolymerans]|uniref:Pectinesterase n=1 Tax=Roseateles depolymerans TaxID=76731 RepID=A0A2W5DRP1_9BURK|nr:MAG: hypothetical protein DI603_06095 [Roseateles depolymerans]
MNLRLAGLPVALVQMALVLTAAPAWGTTRPQLSDAEAARHTEAAYLGSWQPLSAAELANLAAQPPDQWVRPGDSLQAALDRAPAAGQGPAGRRWLIRLAPGEYRGPLCLLNKAPLALIGVPGQPSAVRLVDGRYNALPLPPGQAAHPCLPGSAGVATHGTAGSSSVIVDTQDLVLAHLSIANDALDGVRAGQGYPAGAGEAGGAQAVALTLAGDRLLLHDVQLWGHQDTLYARRGSTPGPARQLLRDSLVAGDVDYVFGDATLVISHSTLLARAGRRAPGQGGITLAPSTAAAQGQGLLVTHSRWQAEPGVAPASVALGRAWDAGVKPGAWQAGSSANPSPNGLAVVRDCELGAHLKPWTASTARRPFASSGEAANRLFEYRNTGPGATP